MTDMMLNSDLTPGTSASVSTPSAPTTPVSLSPVPVTTGPADRPEVGGSWGLLLVPVMICVVLVLYVSLI